MVVVAMLCFVLPEFAAIYQTFNTPLPLLTRLVIHASESLSYGWPLLIVPIVLPAVLNLIASRRPHWLLQRQKCSTRSRLWENSNAASGLARSLPYSH
jgi:protein transport protein HofC